MTDESIQNAIEGLLTDGQRPTVRAVRQWIIEQETTAPSFREIAPALRTWRNRHQTDRSVTKLLAAYNRLDPEQREGFLQLAGLRRRPDDERMAALAEAYRQASAADRKRLDDAVSPDDLEG